MKPRTLFNILRILQILTVMTISFVLSAAFLNVHGNEEISQNMIHGTGAISVIFGIFYAMKLIVELCKMKHVAEQSEFLREALSMGLTIFLDIFGIVVITGSGHVISLWPWLFSQDLIYMSIGAIFLSLLIENFVQGQNFHVLEPKIQEQPRRLKIENSLNRKVCKVNPKVESRATMTDEIPCIIENDGLKVKGSEQEAEVFTTPSVIFKDMKRDSCSSRLSITEQDLETAKKKLRKSSVDSIFKMPRHKMRAVFVEFPNCDDKNFMVDDTDDNIFCALNDEETVDFEKLPKLSGGNFGY